MFFDYCVNTNELTETITSYIIFCENNVVPTKTVKIYPSNNKVWVSHEMKKCLSEKTAAFVQGNMALFKDKRRERLLGNLGNNIEIKWRNSSLLGMLIKHIAV